MKYDDMDLICSRCGEIYGEHSDEDCPDGTKDGFAPLEAPWPAPLGATTPESTKPDPNAWRFACPYDPYGHAEHQRWMAAQACLSYHKEQNRDQPFIAAMAKIEDLLQADSPAEHPIALGQPTEDEKPRSK